MSDLISDLAARGWITTAHRPVDVSLVDWAAVARLTGSAPSRSSPWRAGVRSADRPELVATQKVAVDVLVACGNTVEVIADRLGITMRTVERMKARPVVGRPDPTLTLLFGWQKPAAPRVEVQAGALRDAS